MSLKIELLGMATVIDMALREKEVEIKDNGNLQLRRAFQNVRAKAAAFSKAIPEVSSDLTLKNEIFKNFYDKKNEIIKEIESIKVVHD